MRKIFLLTVLLICAMTAKAQAPQGFSFQAVVRNLDNELVTNTRIKLTLSILQGTTPETASVVYSETHETETNLNGLFTVIVGHGKSGGSFSAVNWSNGNFYLKSESAYGTSVTQLLSVPFAMYAEKAGSVDIDLSDYALKSDIPTSPDLSEYAKKSDIPTDTITDYVLRNESQWNTQCYFDLSEYAKKTDMPSLAFLYGSIDVLKYKLDSLVRVEATKDKLSRLFDVSLNSVNENQVLSFDGSKWVNKTIETKTALSELTDVAISKSLANGHILKYDEENKKWINAVEGDMWKKWSKGIYTSQKVEIGREPVKADAANKDAFIDEDFLLEISKDNSAGVLFKENEIFMKGGSIVVGSPSTAKKIIGGVENVPAGAVAIFGDVNTDHSFAFGINGEKSEVSASQGAIAFGSTCKVISSKCASAFGLNVTVNKAPYQFACGKFNTPMKSKDESGRSIIYPLFIVGNGTSESARSNAFYVNSDGTATLAGALTSSSDSRLKTNVNQISSALDKVVKLRGVTFNWDSSKRPSADKKLQYGFIAQEVEKIFPELVTTDSEGFKSLNYIGIVPVLTEAVKELKKENDELRAMINDLIKEIRKN